MVVHSIPSSIMSTKLSAGFVPNIKPVGRVSISDEIVTQIMSLIANGELKPGQRLPSERELCRKFGAGRSSLREALRCLCIVGVLNARVGEGTSVASSGVKFFGKLIEWRVITEQHDVEDMLELRMALEGVTAASTARQGNAEDLEKLQCLLSGMEAALEDEERFAALDFEFHLTIARFSRNLLIVDLLTMISSQMERTLHRVLLLPNARPLSLKEHAAIFAAIRKFDPEAARRAMHAHLEAAMKRYHTTLLGERISSALTAEAPVAKSDAGPERSRTRRKRAVR